MSGYVPQGRTDEASYDYTDYPFELAATFGAERLREALEDPGRFVTLKFDYEEWVPREAVEEALALATGQGGRKWGR